MDFSFDARTEELRRRLLEFMDSHIYPSESTFEAQIDGLETRWEEPPIMAELKAEARRRGLWNLFLAHSPLGAGLTNLQYAPLAEISGRSPMIAPAALNCSAPDTGNMELLAMFGSPVQQERWLQPLLNGEMRSAFCMTEPDVASSDAANIRTEIRRDGDAYVVNGRKWWSSGAMSPRCRLLIVMGVTDPEADPHHRQSMVLVPTETPGVEIKRSLRVFGFWEAAHGGHAEIDLHDVRVPAQNLVGQEGSGFALAQARLGPGRIHHCMRLIGMAERAHQLMCQRVISRTAFGKPLAEQGVVHEWVAEGRVRIEQARLLVLKTAWLMDTVGSKAARIEISAIKIAVPQMAEWVIDRAIQAHGGGGVSQDFPLGMLWSQARVLRLLDGPDEVHRMALARSELKPYVNPPAEGPSAAAPAATTSRF